MTAALKLTETKTKVLKTKRVKLADGNTMTLKLIQFEDSFEVHTSYKTRPVHLSFYSGEKVTAVNELTARIQPVMMNIWFKYKQGDSHYTDTPVSNPVLIEGEVPEETDEFYYRKGRCYQVDIWDQDHPNHKEFF